MTIGNNFNIQNFNQWTISEENYNKTLSDQKVEDFKMFDFNAETYSSDLKNFSQSYVNQFDEDEDGNWNYNEFVKMATNGETSGANLFLGKVANTLLNKFGIKNEYFQLKADQYDLFKNSFNDLNINDKDNVIDSGEFATMLYASDVDWKNYEATGGDVVSSIDGELDYKNYQAFSSLNSVDNPEDFEILQSQRKDFYNNFYA